MSLRDYIAPLAHLDTSTEVAEVQASVETLTARADELEARVLALEERIEKLMEGTTARARVHARATRD